MKIVFHLDISEKDSESYSSVTVAECRNTLCLPSHLSVNELETHMQDMVQEGVASVLNTIVRQRHVANAIKGLECKSSKVDAEPDFKSLDQI